MSKLAYVEAALQGRQLDRPPCFPLVDVAYASAHVGQAMSQVQLDPGTHADALCRCWRNLPIDGVYINLCLSAEQAACAGTQTDGFSVILDDCLEVQVPTNDVASIARTDIAELDDARIETAELFHPGMLATLRALPKEARGEAAVFAGLTGTFSQLAFLMGLQNLLVRMVDEPERVQQALRRRHRVVIGQAIALCEAGARFVWIGEGVASGSLISPRLYQEFVLPYEQELADELRKRGAWSLLHICGNTTPMLPLIATSRADGCDIDYPTDWLAAGRTLGPHLTLKGNVNPVLFLPANLAELSEACEQAKQAGIRLPRFILSSGCLVPRDASPAAFEVMAQACGL